MGPLGTVERRDLFNSISFRAMAASRRRGSEQVCTMIAA
jgi:hypothetical protein